MICSKCGTQNQKDSKFCISCGNQLESTHHVHTVNQPVVDNTNNSNTVATPSEKVSFMNYFYIIIAVLLKPFTAFKEELHKFDSIKNSLIVTVLVSLVATIISLVQSMISAVRVTSFWSDKVEWVWDNLSKIDYVKVIGTNFLIYALVILIIAGVYYIGSLIAKKQTNFSRLLGITAIGIVPMILSAMVISPLISMIYAPLGMAIGAVGGIYSMIIIYEALNNEVNLEGDKKIYFNVICLAVFVIAAYFLFTQMITSTITSSSSDIWDILGNL